LKLILQRKVGLNPLIVANLREKIRVNSRRLADKLRHFEDNCATLRCNEYFFVLALTLD